MNPPIALFVFSRLEHTQRTVEALSNNYSAEKHDLIIFSDAGKTLECCLGVESVRAFVEKISGFRSVKINHRPFNYGLARSITSGISQVLLEYESVIVVEDDILTSPYFLDYMTESLARYENDERIISISGYTYPTKKKLPETFFVRGADCWGWATWRRGWSIYNANSEYLLSELHRQGLCDDFDMNVSCGYLKMLREQMSGKNDSWAIRWHASAFLSNKLTLYPGRSLVQNIGNDGSGTHGGPSGLFDVFLSEDRIIQNYIDVKESKEAVDAFKEFHKPIYGRIGRIFSRIRSLIKNLKIWWR